MAYETLGLLDGDILTSAHIAHLEQGIADIEVQSNSVKTSLVNILADKGVAATTNETLSELARKFTYLKNADATPYSYEAPLVDLTSTVQSGQIKLILLDKAQCGFQVQATAGFAIDWGDGTNNTYNVTGVQSVNHTYALNKGTVYNGTTRYFVATIAPLSEGRITFFRNYGGTNSSSQSNQIVAFASKDIYFRDIGSMFNRMTALKYIDVLGGSLGINETNTSMDWFCGGCTVLERVRGNVCWSSVTSMANAFANCSSLTTIALGDVWDTKNVTSFSYTFSGSSRLITAPVLVTTAATRCDSMFQNCSLLQTVNGTYDLDSCTTLANMFNGCSALVNVPIFKNVEHITTVTYMFAGCSSLRKLNDDQENLNLISCIDFSRLFLNCSSLEELLDIDYTAATNITDMLYNCTSLFITPSTLYFPNISGAIGAYSNANNGDTGISGLFYNCSSLVSAPQIVAPNAVNVKCLFYNCTNLTTVPSYSFPAAQSASHIFQGCKTLQQAPQILELPKAQYARNLFYDCTALKIAPYSATNAEFSLPEAIEAQAMFYNCTSLQTAPYKINLPKATNIGSLFGNCTSLLTAPHDLIVSKATSLANMFTSCTNMSQAPNITAPLVTTAESIFDGCASLLVCPELNLPVCTNLKYAFRNCTSLTQTLPYIFEKANTVYGMYYGCVALKNIYLLTSNATSLNVTYYAYNCNNLEIIYAPVCTGAHINNQDSNTGLWSGTPVLTTVSNTLDAYNYTTNALNSMFNASSVFDGTITLSGVGVGFTINNRQGLTGLRLTDVRTNMNNIVITNCGLDAEALDLLFNDLPRVSSTRNINVKGNPGVADCTPSIATVKNWTVTTT